MADRKIPHTVTHVAATTNTTEELLAKTKENAMPYRIAAFILWFFGLACEVLAVLFFMVKIDWSVLYEDPGHTIAWIAALVLDLILVSIGSAMWKKANHLNPASAANKTKFWLQNNLGVIIAAVAFIPFIIIALTDKNASKKDKTLASIIAAVALVICCLFGVDWNPVSQEEMLENAGLGDEVYWTESGTVFHAYEDCSHLSNSADLMAGPSTAAIEAGKTRMCKSCEARLAKEEGIEKTGETIAETDENGMEKGGLEIETLPDETEAE